MKLKSIVVSILLVIANISFANDEIGLSVGLESGFGNIVGYPDSFSFWLKPNVEWDILKSGFSLSAGFIIPVVHTDSVALELGEGFTFGVPDTDLELSIANVNSLEFSSMNVAGFLNAGIGYNWTGINLQFHYLSGNTFGFFGVVIVPAVSFEIKSFKIGASFEVGIWTEEEITYTIEPIVGISYSF